MNAWNTHLCWLFVKKLFRPFHSRSLPDHPSIHPSVHPFVHATRISLCALSAVCFGASVKCTLTIHTLTGNGAKALSVWAKNTRRMHAYICASVRERENGVHVCVSLCDFYIKDSIQTEFVWRWISRLSENRNTQQTSQFWKKQKEITYFMCRTHRHTRTRWPRQMPDKTEHRQFT